MNNINTNPIFHYYNQKNRVFFNIIEIVNSLLLDRGLLFLHTKLEILNIHDQTCFNNLLDYKFDVEVNQDIEERVHLHFRRYFLNAYILFCSLFLDDYFVILVEYKTE